MRAAVDELVLAIQQALCAEYGVDRIQDIPAGVLPKLSDEGETEQVIRLIAARCPLDGQNKGGYTGLMNASNKGHVEIVKALILAGAAVDIQDKYDKTVLMAASIEGHIDVVNALILAGAAVDIQNETSNCLKLQQLSFLQQIYSGFEPFFFVNMQKTRKKYVGQHTLLNFTDRANTMFGAAFCPNSHLL